VAESQQPWSPDDEESVTFKLPQSSKIAPFPRVKFLRWLKHLKIQSKDTGGLTPFRLLSSQRYILDEICKAMDDGIDTIKVLKSRQVGATTLLVAIDLFWAFEYAGLLGTFMIHEESARDKWRTMIEVFYHSIAKIEVDGRKVKMKEGIVRHNRNILQFRNSSIFQYIIAGTGENRRGGIGRSGATNYVHSTETAYYGDPDEMSAFTASLSSIYPHRLYIEETTANGFNWWSDDWEEALKSGVKRCIFVGWWRDERKQYATDHPIYDYYMHDPKLTQVERARCRAVKEKYGVHISLQQIAWYRWQLDAHMKGDQSMMDQEFPFTADDAFQATGSNYFTGESLTEAMRIARQRPYQRYKYRMTNKWHETEVIAAPKNPNAELKIWEPVSQFGYYVLACDPAYASSEDADANCIQVWRCFSEGIRQCAEMCTNELSAWRTAWAIAHLGGYYGINQCQTIIEVNNVGAAVFKELRDLLDAVRQMKPTPENRTLRTFMGNVRHFFYQRFDNPGGTEFAYQWKTTSQLKPMIMAAFKDAFELGRLHIRSTQLLEEMRTIVNDAGHIAAEGAKSDDRVMTGAMAYEAYKRWMQAKLRNMGMSEERSFNIEQRGGIEPIEQHVINFLRKKGIQVKV
jgi:hypothetical protein